MPNRPAGGDRSKRWERAPYDLPEHKRVRLLGKAGEHIVCADLLMQGWVANLAAEGQGYDVIAERDGLLTRIAVKSTLEARPRRKGARDAYRFDVSRRLPAAMRRRERYTKAETDIIALVTLDTKRVGYIAVDECPILIWIYADHAEPVERRFGPKASCMRKFDQLSLMAALYDADKLTKWQRLGLVDQYGEHHSCPRDLS